ncbi:alpha/beta hydrolase fold-domain-containing protein [Gilbertella persicaria]|uniref:alpha/beta hydrolase fold-domain-containing protein n=1 Tax=Gilbertella persicaria TaxID=101096 RepID=UPI00221E600E|nr:alpha/beta hydrolase fold-domain-containing protein [Gilbertella persicaria]KAI8049797.1 alpha/beta hydrolase fold-domain-containing protein [Gilbertella persicaria]
MSKPLLLSPQTIPLAKSILKVETDEEACEPHNVRIFFDHMSAMTIAPEVEKQDMEINANGYKIHISVLRPIGSKDTVLPVILFIHGGGWIFGSYTTHRVLTNNLVNLMPACIVFVHYSLSPEVKYPTALEECYATLCWVQQNAASIHVDPHRLVVMGDSAGGNLSTSLTILAKQRGNKGISYQVLYYPALDINFESESYIQNQHNSFLPRSTMLVVWDAYLNHANERHVATAVPMSSPKEVLEGLPPALIITAEADVLRTEGELYANKLTEAGVETMCVRYLGVRHGFLSAPQLRSQAHAAIAQTIDVLKKHWKEESTSRL